MTLPREEMSIKKLCFSSKKMAESPLSMLQKMANYFDPHILMLLLNFHREIGTIDGKWVAMQKIRVAMNTNMIDLIRDEFNIYKDDNDMKALNKSMENDLNDKKSLILSQINNLETENVKKVIELFKNNDKEKLIEVLKDLNINSFTTAYNITQEMMLEYYKYAKFKYECGQYSEAEAMLANYLIPTGMVGHDKERLGAYWGRLACYIMLGNWESSCHVLESLKKYIERMSVASEQLVQRAWLLHWALFVQFNQRDDRDLHFDIFSDRSYVQTIENLCPWMMRYHIASIIISNRRRVSDRFKEIKSFETDYEDSFTEFIKCLYEKFDFDEAKIKLEACKKCIKNDFFLQVHETKFIYKARSLICEVYCTINHTVDLPSLASKLELSEEEAEKWMVDMVRNASFSSALDARIDSSSKRVVMSSPTKLALQDIMERTRDLTTRTSNLMGNLDSLLSDQALYIRDRRSIVE